VSAVPSIGPAPSPSLGPAPAPPAAANAAPSLGPAPPAAANALPATANALPAALPLPLLPTAAALEGCERLTQAAAVALKKARNAANASRKNRGNSALAAQAAASIRASAEAAAAAQAERQRILEQLGACDLSTLDANRDANARARNEAERLNAQRTLSQQIEDQDSQRVQCELVSTQLQSEIPAALLKGFPSIPEQLNRRANNLASQIQECEVKTKTIYPPPDL
jgi:hypothetical protein